MSVPCGVLLPSICFHIAQKNCATKHVIYMAVRKMPEFLYDLVMKLTRVACQCRLKCQKRELVICWFWGKEERGKHSKSLDGAVGFTTRVRSIKIGCIKLTTCCHPVRGLEWVQAYIHSAISNQGLHRDKFNYINLTLSSEQEEKYKFCENKIWRLLCYTNLIANAYSLLP